MNRRFAASLVALLIPGLASADERDGFIEADSPPASESGPSAAASSETADSAPQKLTAAGPNTKTTRTPVTPARVYRSSPGLGECILVPEADCEAYPVIELGMGWGVSDTYLADNFTYHPFVEAGLLAQTPGVPHLHVGPMAELGFDTGPFTSGWTLHAKARARYFVGGSPFVLEGGLGPAFSRFVFDHGTESGTRAGWGLDFGLGFAGMVGPWTSMMMLADPGGATEQELRWVVGFRANISAWGFLLAPLSNGIWQ